MSVAALLLGSGLTTVAPAQAATPGPNDQWSGSITVTITIRTQQVKSTLSDRPGPTVEGSCSATITLNGATETGTATMTGKVVWQDYPQKGETSTTIVKSDSESTVAPPPGKGAIQITPHPNFNTADYQISGFGLPAVPATVDTVITGSPTGGGPADRSPSPKHDSLPCAPGGMSFLNALGFAAGKEDRFGFAFPSGTSAQSADTTCQPSSRSARLADLHPIIIQGTAVGDGSVIADNDSKTPKACVIDIADNSRPVGTVVATWNLKDMSSTWSTAAASPCSNPAGGAATPGKLIPWGTRPLTWGDFRGAPPAKTPWAAETRWEIPQEYSVPPRSLVQYNAATGLYELRVPVSLLNKPAAFDATRSWAKPATARGSDSTRILDHECRHFDIAEYYARRVSAALKAVFLRSPLLKSTSPLVIQATCKTAQQCINEFQALLNRADAEATRLIGDERTGQEGELGKVQKQYDAETNHGLDRVKQQAWDDKVACWLSMTP